MYMVEVLALGFKAGDPPKKDHLLGFGGKLGASWARVSPKP